MFPHHQQLAGDASTDRMAVFREKNNLAEAHFVRAAEAYAGQVDKLTPRQFSIDVYLAWFHSLLGINSDGRLNLSKPLDRRALNTLREALRKLPEPVVQPHINLLAKHVQARLDDTENPLHEELKYKYLAGSLVITKESPFAFQAGDKVAYYDDLLDETRLTTRVDGPNTIHRDHEFGIIFSVQHTEALGRMADFGKYLVNELPPANSPARRSIERSLVPTYRMGELQGRRDLTALNFLRQSLQRLFGCKQQNGYNSKRGCQGCQLPPDQCAGQERADGIPDVTPDNEVRGDLPPVLAGAEPADNTECCRVEAGMAEGSQDGKGHDQIIVPGDSHEGNKDGADKETDADADGKPPRVREPADDRLGEGRGNVIGGHEKSRGKVGVPVLGDEERQDSREHRHIDVSDHMGSGKTGGGLFHAAGLVQRIRFSRSISTSISCTSLVWKAKVRFIGNAPPIFSVISAFCAV